MQQNLLKPHEVKPEFWEQFFPILEKTRKNFAQFALSHEQYPEFMGHIDELAKKAGLKYVPHVVIQHIGIGSGVVVTPNAFTYPHAKGIVINPQMMELTNANIHSRLPDKLESFLAHELGHMKDGFLHYWSLHAAGLCVAPVVAMAGLYLYDKAHKKTLDEGNSQNKEAYANRVETHLHNIADEEIKKIQNEKKTEGWQIDPEWKKGVINAGRYSMAAALGLALGVTGTRYGGTLAEYRADRMVAKISKVEPFKEVLSTIRTDVEKIWAYNAMIVKENGGEFECFKRNMQYRIKQRGFFSAVTDYIREKYAYFTTFVHPDDKTRFAALDNFAKKIEAERATTAQAAIGL
jgi:hypothetical protein